MKGYKYWEFSTTQLSCERVTLFTAYTLINQYVPGKTLRLRGVIVHFARNSRIGQSIPMLKLQCHRSYVPNIRKEKTTINICNAMGYLTRFASQIYLPITLSNLMWPSEFFVKYSLMNKLKFLISSSFLSGPSSRSYHVSLSPPITPL